MYSIYASDPYCGIHNYFKGLSIKAKGLFSGEFYADLLLI